MGKITVTALQVNGMSCGPCASSIEYALSATDEVQSAAVNLAAEKVALRYHGSVVQLANLKQQVKDIGYELVGPNEHAGDEADEQTVRSPRRRLVTASVFNDRVLRVQISKVGKDTFLSPVIKLVKECQGTTVPVQEFVDRVSGASDQLSCCSQSWAIFRKVKENYFSAWFYNVVALPSRCRDCPPDERGSCDESEFIKCRP